MATFVIAKIGHRYRNLTGLRGPRQLRNSLMELIEIFRAPENRLLLEHELRCAHRLVEDDWALPNHCYDQFPFLTTCLATAFLNFTNGQPSLLGHARTFRVNSYSEMPGRMRAAIIDISDLSKLRCCFMGPKPEYRIISATDITSAHLHDSVSGAGVFADIDLLTRFDLDSLWASHVTDHYLEGLRSATNAAVPTLRTLAMETTVERVFAIQHRELPELLESLKYIPDFRQALKTKLYSKPQIITGSQTAGQLLSFALANDTLVDLSPFTLTDIQIADTLFESKYRNTNITALSLAGKENIQEKLLEELLFRNKELRVLYVMNTPQISLETKLCLIRQSSVVELIDFQLLARAFQDDKPTSDHLLPDQHSTEYINSPLVQMGMFICPSRNIPRLENGEIDMGESTRRFYDHDRHLSAEERQAVHMLAFKSTNRPPLAFFFGLFNFLGNALRSNLWGTHKRLWKSRNLHYRRLLALHLATSSETAGESSHRVRPLSAHLYHTEDLGCADGNIRRLPEPVREGEWTFLLVVDNPDPDQAPDERLHRPACKYAFITAASSQSAKISENAYGHAATSIHQPTVEGPRVAIASISEYLGNIMPGEEEDISRARNSVVSAWRSATSITTEGNHHNTDTEGEICQACQPKLCSKEEVESWLRSSDFHKAKPH